MKIKRIISIMLVLSMCLSMLLACDDTTDNNNGGGGDRVEGSWEGVDFGGQEVGLCISVNKYDECNFPAANIYTKGPDKAGSNEVAKEVLARNKQAQEELGITIKYTTRDLGYAKVLEDIQSIVMTSSKSSPDIYNNDIYGLARAMCNGYLWNVVDPGEGIKNYFDFNAEGWYTEYIKGCTFDPDKLYIFAGDYFIDMIRMAWVVLVNNDLFTQNIGKMPKWCKNLDTFYDYIADGFWDLDIIAEMAGRAFVDSGFVGETEVDDKLVGLVINSVTSWITSASSGVTVFYQDENRKPQMMQSIDQYQKIANKYCDMKERIGVYETVTNDLGMSNSVLACTAAFLNGNVLFAYSRLGEMESESLRNFQDAKGLVPIPKWEDDEQDEYNTPVHDQAELGCILNTAKAFSASSALMQYLNEESGKVVHAYYEKGLKYKYNDDRNSRNMMDIVRATTGSPFSWQIGDVCLTLYNGTPALQKLYLHKKDTVASTFASEKDVYAQCLREMIAKFEKLD